jgi:hypothetical protein
VGIIATTFSLDLLDDQLGVTFYQQLLDSKRQCGFEPKDEGLILCHVVSCCEVEAHHVHELLPTWSQE